MRFTELFRPPYMQGHKVFRDEAGRIAIADWSGTMPQHTDNGVLYIDPQRFIVADSISERHGVSYTLPLLDLAGDKKRTATTSATVKAVLRAMPQMRVEIGPALKPHLDEINQLVALRGAFLPVNLKL